MRTECGGRAFASVNFFESVTIVYNPIRDIQFIVKEFVVF